MKQLLPFRKNTKINLPEHFDADEYIKLNPDVANAINQSKIASAEQHYIEYGRKEGRKYNTNTENCDIESQLIAQLPEGFDSASYLELNGDIEEAIAAGFCPSAEVHYLNYGRHEGRTHKLTPQIIEAMSSSLGQELFRYPYSSIGAMPEYKFLVPRRSARDIEICERLINAWHFSAASNPGKTGGMWDQITAGHARLKCALEKRNPETLSQLLSNMFQEHLVHGIAMGKSTAANARCVPHRHAAIWCDRLLRFGEAVGVCSVRSPEQGGLVAPLEWQDIISQIEHIIGFELVFSDVGAPYGVALKGSVFPEQSFTHAYAAWRINSIGSFKSIAEIGGGYGGLCAYLSRNECTYTIYDLPYTNILQGYFLLRCGFPVSLGGERPNQIQILPWWNIYEKDAKFDLVINQDSIPEMSIEAGKKYIDRIKQITPNFYSVNQEASALNGQTGRQLRVPDLIKSCGGYDLKSRNLFWLRDGYVEELYSC